MFKINDALDRTGKIVSSIATIALGMAVISFAAKVTKDNCKALFGKRIKAIVCIKKHVEEKHSDDNSEKPVNGKGRNSKGQFTKKTKKIATEAGMDAQLPSNDEPKLESVE